MQENKNDYVTVTALTKYIKWKFEHDHHLEDIFVTGEISNFKHHSRGHFYFTLKDDGAAIGAMMFASSAMKVKFEPKDGMKVFLRGRISVYEPSGTYQIVVSEMKSDGVGDLYLAYEQLKKELGELGLFDPAHKKPIPQIPKVIGVITSPTGAAIKDIINTITRRFPFCKVILYPALVQGEEAKNSIVEQIKLAEEQALCDVLIVGRGGGSIEDLWAFNEKIVAYAIYNCNIPIISAVGHEIDFTIADFVADKRAATPTAAAEIATPNKDVLKQNIIQIYGILNKNIKNFFDNYKLILGNLEKSLDNNSPKTTLIHKREIVDAKFNSLGLMIKAILANKENSYKVLIEKLKALNPLQIMDKGYSIAKHNNEIVRSVKQVKENDLIDITLNDGSIKAKVMEVNDGKSR